jgi:uncharacterized protein
MTDGPYKPMLHKSMHPGLQFVMLVVLLFAFLVFGQIIAGAIVTAKYGMNTLLDISNLKLSSPQAQSSLWIIQFAGTTIPILLTPIVFSYFVVHEPDEYMKNNFHFPGMFILLVFVIMMLSFPLIEFIGNLNQKIPLSKSLRDYEYEIQKMSDSMMQMNTFWGMIFDLLFIGLLTAIIEEVLFRGVMQTVFVHWTKNKHAAVWIVAILFSAFHMEFSGFLPRVFLGLLFGYFTAWSGSIWPAIWGHFVNNGTIVVITYLAQQKLVNVDPNDQHSFNNVTYVVCLIVTVVLLYFYHYIAVKRQMADHGEELG